jgi:ribosomal protein S6--L-glutamate ligase
LLGCSAIWVLTDRRYARQRMPLAVVEWLTAEGYEPGLVVADDGGLISGLASASPAPNSPWTGLAARDVVVARSRHPLALALLDQAEALGARPCDRLSAVLAVRDKVRCTAALIRRGIPVPPTFLARRPEDLARLPAHAFPLVLKPVLGDNARGLHVIEEREQLASVAWPEELVLAQRYVDAGGVDLKVYVAGANVWAVRRPSPLAPHTDAPVAVPVTPPLRKLVRACREEFGLLLFGLDVLESKEGPVVVDVNEFPNYTGVDEAPAAIGRLVLREAGRGRPRARTPEEARA